MGAPAPARRRRAVPPRTARPTVWFDRDSATPRRDPPGQVEELAAAAMWHLDRGGPAARVTLHGYASPEGPEAHNLELSRRRAERVRRDLEAAGVPPERIAVRAHGEDATHPEPEWNRRVAAELTPQAVAFEPVEVEGRRPRTGPVPVERTDALTSRHSRLLHKQPIAADPVPVWETADAMRAAAERAASTEGTSRHLADYKDRWVRAHRHVIRAAAAESDIPDWVLAGVAWTEVGGDPPVQDEIAVQVRRHAPFTAPPERTSFGPLSLQLRRAAEELGYEPARMTHVQQRVVIWSLEDPQQALFIAARHLRRLRDVDFPAVPAELLTDDQVRVLGARYNRGPDLSLERIRANTSYGDALLRKRDRMMRLLGG